MAVEKLLPQNLEAEAGVLGSLLIDPEATVQVADFLRPDDFYREAHRLIYQAMLDLFEESQPADLITLTDELARRGKLEDAGGYAYVTSLANQVPTSANAEHYAHIVERTAVLRRLIHAAGQIAAVAYDEPDALTALDEAERLVFNVSQRFVRSDLEHLRDTLAEYMEKLDQLQHRRGDIVGVATGFNDLDKMTGGLQKSDMIILAARPSQGKCLTARTLIDDPATGERLTIEECVQRKLPRIYGMSAQGKVRGTTVADWIDSGVQPVFGVRTATGRMVEVTGHHPFLTVRGWTPLHDLEPGDTIAVPRQLPTFGHEESTPLALVRLLAYFIAGGELTNSSPEFTNTDPVIVEDFKQIIAEHFSACAVRQDRITYIVAQPRTREYEATDGGSAHPNPVKTWLKELGLWGKLAKEKVFPACVWTWSERHLAEFIKVIMSCDGSIYVNRGYPTIEFTVASERLAADMHHALVRFGIVARLSPKGRAAWRVVITSPEAIARYQQRIGWLGAKVERFATYERALPKRMSNVGHVPREVWALLRATMSMRSLTMVELARRAGETTSHGKLGGYNPHTGRTVPRGRLSGYAEVLNDKHLRMLASPDLYWDKIIAIEPLGEQQVYDLTVPDGENFVAQDVLVHNTALALSLAHNAALRYGHTIGFFSLEMSKDQLAARLLSMDASVDQQRLRLGMLNDDEWDRIGETVGRLSEANIYIDDTPGIRITEMRSKARRLLMEHGCDLLIVDYLQLMQGAHSRGGSENRQQEISDISRGLKGLARELNIPVMALSQLSRAVESRTDKRPQLSDLRECVVGDTLLIDASTGRHVPITDVKPGDKVLGMDHDQKIGCFAVDSVWSTGVKPIFTLTTRTGKRITATANHPLFTPLGWKPLGEIQPGDVVAGAMRLPDHGQELPNRAPLCRLLGYLIGDGTYLKHKSVGFISSDPGTMDDVCSIVAQHFPEVRVHAKAERGAAHEVNFSTTDENGYGKPCGNPLREWLRSLGIVEQRDNEKHVPAWVFEAGCLGAREFLAGYLAADGCVKRDRMGWGIHFDTVSRRLAEDVQALLMRLGIVARIDDGRFYPKSTQLIYRVYLAYAAANICRFADLVPVHGQKAQRLAEALAELSGISERRSASTHLALPRVVSALVAERSRKAYQEQNIPLRDAWEDEGNRMQRSTCLEWAVKLNDDELHRWATSDLLWEEVVTVEPIGRAEVFDIRIPGCGNFVANGLIAHNSGSLEQDADIVMFIYRDEYYNAESEKKNIADIIIAKHRNGPVGDVSLYFQKAQTRFRDLDLRTPEPY